MKPSRKRALAGLALAAALTGACGGGSNTDQPDGAGGSASKGSESSATEVAVVNIAYSPETITVEAGTEVLWVNDDKAVHHTVTSGTPAGDTVPGVSKGKPEKADGVFDGDLPDESADFSFTFEKPGTYEYFCRVHPSMTGKVIVE